MTHIAQLASPTIFTAVFPCDKVEWFRPAWAAWSRFAMLHPNIAGLTNLAANVRISHSSSTRMKRYCTLERVLRTNSDDSKTCTKDKDSGPCTSDLWHGTSAT